MTILTSLIIIPIFASIIIALIPREIPSHLSLTRTTQAEEINNIESYFNVLRKYLKTTNTLKMIAIGASLINFVISLFI